MLIGIALIVTLVGSLIAIRIAEERMQRNPFLYLRVGFGALGLLVLLISGLVTLGAPEVVWLMPPFYGMFGLMAYDVWYAYRQATSAAH